MAQSLYIHWPFCLAKCPYCDFNSHVRERTDMAAWEAALLADMRAEYDATVSHEPLISIFFGGGTPSLMPPKLVASLLREAERLWGFAPDIEITLEGNPSSVEAANFADLASAGINRVSLGVQSLRDEALHFLGRLHGVEEALAAIETANRHFSRVSIDLIYARPEQTPEQWHQELSEALELGTSHMSLYQLTIEPTTRFATDVRRGVFDPLDDDPAADLFALTREMTAKAGLPAYEISNHARPGEESRHNLTYWRYRDYHGIGPGAHGRRAGIATLRHKKPENFLAAVERHGSGMSEQRRLGIREQASEALLMGLRLTEGIDLADLSRRFSIPREGLVNSEKLALYSDLGLIAREDDHLAVTDAGMPLLDALLGELVPEELVAQ
ncbi:radical SAM family heme chaperone HemW [Qipengyuania vesicularis]|uniref:radical SAM family heme chaperone HemW n=1 Tax=Qipengyuania vesicularis TaxID=2867232 RepID=UPI001C87EBE9|nr:radical SAM family heme chaperone HemW [Qipengyuania vesicularis]MBX7526778.1 radical SAM family heme chaperone HemW [Qipengyuania vesicularis]